MGLRINQNISAMNAARNLRSTNASMSKSLERLSSGYRINRAADDPAGMIISENLRAQIAGLGQAIKNSDNAVNVIKTSEAALDEVLKQLRSIRTLAIDALTTGSSDATARAADQIQIDSSIETIDRIGNTTQYGTIKLLNGSSGVKGSTNSDDLKFISGTSDTKASGTTGYGVEITQLATQGTVSFKINNEFATADTAATGDVILGAANQSSMGFQIKFGASTLTTLERAQLGANLKAGGLVGSGGTENLDTSKSGVTVTFNEAEATAYVGVDDAALQGGAADTVTQAFLDNLNESSLGTAVRMSGATTADELNVTGRYAGLEFTVTDFQGTASGARLGFGADGAAAAGGLAGTNMADTANADISELLIDFGTGLAVQGKAALGKALRAAGLVDKSVAATGNGAATLSVSLNEATAVVTLTLDEVSTAHNIAAVSAALNEAATAAGNKSNIGKFVRFSVSGSKLQAASNLAMNIKDVANAVQSQNGPGETTDRALGFTTTGGNSTISAGISSAEVTKLAGNSRGPAVLGQDNAVTISEIKTVGENLTINESSVVTIAAGTALTSIVSRIRSVIEADDLELTVTFTPDTDVVTTDNNVIKFTNTKFGSAKNDIKSTRSKNLGHQMGVGVSPVNVQGKDVAGTINDVQAEGDGQFLTLNSKGDNADGIKLKYGGDALPTVNTLKSFNLQGSLLFQIGANAGQTVTQAIDDIRARKLGTQATGLVTTAQSIADVNVTTSDGAKDALTLVDQAITDITTLRGKLGAFQMNILESNINSLGVAQESLASAESVIRDADFADETVAFTRTQILLQAGTAILTQANAIPQAVLQLLA